MRTVITITTGNATSPGISTSGARGGEEGGRRSDRAPRSRELTVPRYDSATIRARAFRLSFISLISLSTSSMNLAMRTEQGGGIVRLRTCQQTLPETNVMQSRSQRLSTAARRGALRVCSPRRAYPVHHRERSRLQRRAPQYTGRYCTIQPASRSKTCLSSGSTASGAVPDHAAMGRSPSRRELDKYGGARSKGERGLTE